MVRGLAGLALIAAALATAPAASAQRPPPTVLVSAAGTQGAVQESACTSVIRGDRGVTGCFDTPDLPPRVLSVVRPGERVAIRLRGVTAVSDGVGLVTPLGPSRRVVRRFELTGPETRWRVRLRPGRYELEIFARFEAPGRSGDTSVTFGLLVSRTRPLAIVPAPRPVPPPPLAG